MAKVEHLNLIGQHQVARINRIERLSTLLNVEVAGARDSVNRSSSAFESALSDSIISLIVVIGLIMLITGLVVYFVVEKQINRRLAKLANSVSAIAHGDLNREAEVKGVDELGVIASSLEIFKDTAYKLCESNKEMEQFAYAASHDLRSPLRAIENLAQWTLEDSGPELPAECSQNLKTILKRTKRLSVLQSDLLEYSRAGHTETVRDLVSMPELVVELAQLVDADGSHEIRYTGISDRVSTFITPLRQVLINLIGNAIKHHDMAGGSIVIKMDMRQDRAILSVSDDGPGIEVQYQERIFGLFSRLQSADEVEGSGLGLALVQKLVLRYGGVVSVVSDPTLRRGTECKFDWPVAVSH